MPLVGNQTSGRHDQSRVRAAQFDDFFFFDGAQIGPIPEINSVGYDDTFPEKPCKYDDECITDSCGIIIRSARFKLCRNSGLIPSFAIADSIRSACQCTMRAVFLGMPSKTPKSVSGDGE